MTATRELIVREPTEQGLYPVQSGEKVYYCDAALGECDCPWFVWRCARSHDACKHLRAVREHIEARLRCPACRGKGFIAPMGLIRYVTRSGEPDPGPWECCLCSGSGKGAATI